MKQGEKLVWYVAAASAVCGSCCFTASGMRFSGLVFWAAALWLLLLAVLFRLGEKKRWARYCARTVLALCCAFAALFLYLEGKVLSGARGDAPEDAACVLILGAGVDGTQPSLILRSRLDAALAYLAEHPDIPVVVSGCRGAGEEISEAECMENYLTAHGVDAARVWKEERASSTTTNFRYSFALMAERGVGEAASVAIVTNEFHAARVRFIARSEGVAERIGIVTASLPHGMYESALTTNYFIREAFALANEKLLGVDLDL